MAAMPSGRCRPSAFGMYLRRNGKRSIRPCVYPRVEILKVTLEAFRVLVPRHIIHARRSPLLQTEESLPEAVDVDVMQKRRESFLLVPVDGLTYASLRL